MAIYSKLSMRPVDRAGLSEHELKRCRAVARGRPWQVWQEDILWWSTDRQSWFPVDDALWPRRRRWLLVEAGDGVAPALIWDVGQGLQLPEPADPADSAHSVPRQPTEDLAEVL